MITSQFIPSSLEASSAYILLVPLQIFGTYSFLFSVRVLSSDFSEGTLHLLAHRTMLALNTKARSGLIPIALGPELFRVARFAVDGVVVVGACRAIKHLSGTPRTSVSAS